MNIRFIYFFFALFFIFQQGKAQKDVTVPDIASFNTEAGSQSSVNQANGKLGITLPLVSLKGYKDLNAQFSIAYDGASVVKNASSSSEYAPTSVLGLGWGMQFPRIFADNKLTAARDDDTFYIADGGALNKLIAVEDNGTRISFKQEKFNPWKIYYYPASERWEVIKENGYKYNYDNVDWVVYWDNWIGNSNEGGASRQGSSWNLTTIEDLNGNEVNYEYTNVEQSLTNTGAIKHTEATYLDKIIGPLGGEIRFVYGNKQSGEYFHTNTNQAEPDAYQEVYEKKFLNEVRVYNKSNTLLYKYDFQYQTINSSTLRKRLLNKIILINGQNEDQVFREFEYETNSSSDFFGTIKHQILPTKGRISYQYAVNEVPIDQIFEINSTDNTSYVIRKNYILKLTGTNDLYILKWNGSTWEETLIHEMPSGGVQGDFKSLHIVAKEDFFAVLHPNPTVDRIFLAGLENNGKTWKTAWLPFHHPGVSNFLELRMFGGNDFVAVGNPKQDRIDFYRWNGASWITEQIYNNTAGNYYYTATNNYIIQHRENSNPDRVWMYYYDQLGNLQMKILNTGINASGGSNGNDPTSYWYGQNSFALVNANQSPEYAIRWDKNYNYIGKEAPYGSITDGTQTFGIFNNYYALTKEDINSHSDSETTVIRYNGNGNWNKKVVNGAPFLDDLNTTGFGPDVFVHPWTDHPFGDNTFHLYNANIDQWVTTSYNSNSTIQNEDKSSYDVFANRYVFANRNLYRINQDLTISNRLSFPDNTSFTHTDGSNLLYASSRGVGIGVGSAFARIVSIQPDNSIFQHTIENDYYLRKNPYKNFPSHVMGYGTLIMQKSGENSAKIYKLIDNKIEFNQDGDPVYKDVVIVKEVYDPVITRKQRNFYCYANPKMDQNNNRVTYQYVSQFNDIEAVLGKSVTSYDLGEGDIRKIGLPKKIRLFDGEGQLVSEQINEWQVNDISNSYYINISSKNNIAFEGSNSIENTVHFEYDFNLGFLKKTITTDSEGNEEISENTYIYEVYPASEDLNLLSPVVATKSYTQEPNAPYNERINKSATAVKWAFSPAPHPTANFAWKGIGAIDFNFGGGSNSTYRSASDVGIIDGYGNIIENKNRSEVTTAYIYGYEGKRLVAKVEGATHSAAMSHIDNNSILINPASAQSLENELNKIRQGLPDAFVTTYAYNPSVGLIQQTDARGRTMSYHYDDFYRLDYIKNNEGEIVKKSSYAYREAPFNYTTESNALPDCTIEGAAVGDPTDPNDPDFDEPLTLTLIKIAENGNSVSFKVIPSESGSYTYNWNYSAIQGNISDFPETIIGDTLHSVNPDCNDGILSVSVSVQVVEDVDGVPSTVTKTSNILNHTYSSSSLECMNQ